MVVERVQDDGPQPAAEPAGRIIGEIPQGGDKLREDILTHIIDIGLAKPTLPAPLPDERTIALDEPAQAASSPGACRNCRRRLSLVVCAMASPQCETERVQKDSQYMDDSRPAKRDSSSIEVKKNKRARFRARAW